MVRFFIRRCRPGIVVLAVVTWLSTVSATADEGMWLLPQIQALKLTQKGFKIRAAEIYRPDGPCLARAIVNLGGGTAAFVSGQGLLLTNHHVAYRGIQQISSKEHNYLRDGFRARTRQEERPVSGYSATVTLRCEEVTDRILKGLKKNASEEERTRHVRARTEAVINETRPSVPDKAVRFQVKELFDGAAFYLYHLKTYRDVRLVYAPPAAIGEFGGDPDNWMWPRHCGDFSLMRVYAGPGGEPARRQDANVPLVPEQWLKLSRRGVKEGDLTFILGFPARTHRELTAHSVRYHRDTSLPTNIERFQSMADRISGTNSSDGARPLRSLPALKGILNGLKNYQGKVEWMKKKGLVESLKAVEDELARFVRRRTTLQRKYGTLFDDLDEAYRRVANSEQLSARMKQVDRLQVMRVAAVLHQLGIERARPDASRNRRFRENRLDRLKTRTLRGWDEVDLAAEGKAFEEAIAAFHDVPDEALPEALREVVKGQPAGDARRDALAGMARRVWKETRLKDPKTAPAWFDLDAAKQQELKDPLLDLAGSLAGVRSGLSQARGEQRYKAHRRALHEVRQIQHPGPTYPDADGTLRFTYGRVRGYRPRDAVDYDYITSLGGVVEKETGQEPFASPPRLLTLHRKRDFGPYVDAHLKDVPVAFVQDTDITGGNSGSPVLDARGEVVGVAFDGNWEAITNDYRYEPDLTRTIAVDLRYVLFVIDKFSDAKELLEELGGRK